MTILAFDPDRRTNAQAIIDARDLGWIEGRVLDATYGRGAFWALWQPDDLTTNDLYTPADHNIDVTNLVAMKRLGRYDTVIFDPDYRLNGTPDRGDRDERYGVQEPKTANDRMRDLVHGAIACATVADQHVLVKCQDQVCSGYMHRQAKAVDTALEANGWRWADEIYVVHTPPKQRSQRHARHNTSVLMHFVKGKPKRWS